MRAYQVSVCRFLCVDVGTRWDSLCLHCNGPGILLPSTCTVFQLRTFPSINSVGPRAPYLIMGIYCNTFLVNL